MKNILNRKSETYVSPAAEIMELVSAEMLCSSKAGQVEDYNFLGEQTW